MATFQNAKKPFKFSLKHKKKFSRRRRMTEAGTLNLSLPVVWPAFLVSDPFVKIKDVRGSARAWDLINTNNDEQPVGRYITSLRVGWLISLLVHMIANSSEGRLHYVVNFTADLNRLDQEFLRFDIKKLEENPYTPINSFVFLLIYVANGEEAVAVILIDNGKIEIFFPYPYAWSDGTLMKKIMCETVIIIRRDWMKIKDNQECATMTDVSIYEISLSNGFESSNIWVTYFLLKRMMAKPADIQKAFLSSSNQLQKMLVEAVYLFQRAANILTNCISQVASGNSPQRTAALQLKTEMYSATATRPAIITDQIFVMLRDVMETCPVISVMNSLQPQQQQPQTSESLESLERFIAVPGSSAAKIMWNVPEYATKEAHPEYNIRTRAIMDRCGKGSSPEPASKIKFSMDKLRAP